MALLKDGFSTTFHIDTGDYFGSLMFEIEITPPSLSTEGTVDTTTMRNTATRTKQGKKLVTMGDIQATISYDSIVYQTLVNFLTQNKLMQVKFPDGSTVTFWGTMTEFKPNKNSEGARPTAEITLVPTLRDASGNQVQPAYAA